MLRFALNSIESVRRYVSVYIYDSPNEVGIWLWIAIRGDPPPSTSIAFDTSYLINFSTDFNNFWFFGEKKPSLF